MIDTEDSTSTTEFPSLLNCLEMYKVVGDQYIALVEKWGEDDGVGRGGDW